MDEAKNTKNPELCHLLLQWRKKKTKTEQCIVGPECKAELQNSKRQKGASTRGWGVGIRDNKNEAKNKES